MTCKGTLGRFVFGKHRRQKRHHEVERSDSEWQERLTPEQYRILRRRGTERPFSGEYVHPGHRGQYRCAGCRSPLFAAVSQFDSGTGWPSFTSAVPDGVDLQPDLRMGIPRTEVSCRRCGGHLGHLFRDGPGPDRSRYCINSCALVLEEDDADARASRPRG